MYCSISLILVYTARKRLPISHSFFFEIYFFDNNNNKKHFGNLLSKQITAPKEFSILLVMYFFVCFAKVFQNQLWVSQLLTLFFLKVVNTQTKFTTSNKFHVFYLFFSHFYDYCLLAFFNNYCCLCLIQT